VLYFKIRSLIFLGKVKRFEIGINQSELRTVETQSKNYLQTTYKVSVKTRIVTLPEAVYNLETKKMFFSWLIIISDCIQNAFGWQIQCNCCFVFVLFCFFATQEVGNKEMTKLLFPYEMYVSILEWFLEVWEDLENLRPVHKKMCWGIALSSSAAWPKLGRSVSETFFTSCENVLA
jgi:hypothetical protein